MSRFLICMLLALLYPTTGGTAQSPRGLAAGQRVRLAHRCQITEQHLIECRADRSARIDSGLFRTLDRDTLRVNLAPTDAELAIPVAYIDELWALDGKRRHIEEGAGVGLLVGALIGGIIASQSFIDSERATAFGVVVGAPYGLVVGGIVGALIRSDRWRPVSLDGVDASLLLRDGMRLGVSLRF